MPPEPRKAAIPYYRSHPEGL